MANAGLIGKQTNVTYNAARSLVFFEGSGLCFNYKTGQWSAVPAYSGLGMYSINSKTASIGLVAFTANARASIYAPSTSDTPQAAKLTTGEDDWNQGGRTFVKGVRPLADGGTWLTRVGKREDLSTATPTYSTAVSVTTRTGMADFRQEGRYLRLELACADGFNTFIGVDADMEPAGMV